MRCSVLVSRISLTPHTLECIYVCSGLEVVSCLCADLYDSMARCLPFCFSVRASVWLLLRLSVVPFVCLSVCMCGLLFICVFLSLCGCLCGCLFERLVVWLFACVFLRFYMVRPIVTVCKTCCCDAVP